MSGAIFATLQMPAGLGNSKQGSPLIHRFLSISAMLFLLSACTTGELYYTKASGERVLGCDVEFVGLPSVDKFAVEYALSLCAKSSVKKGYSIEKEKEYLLTLELQIPESRCGESWNHKSAKELYKTCLLYTSPSPRD